MGGFKNNKNLQGHLLKEINKKQNELVSKAKECKNDFTMYDFSYIIKKRTVCMKTDSGLYAEFSFTNATYDELFNRKIKSIQMQIDNMK